MSIINTKATIALVALLGVTACLPEDYPSAPRFDPPPDEVVIPEGELFIYQPPAGVTPTAVAVPGEFNGWNPAAPEAQMTQSDALCSELDLDAGCWVVGIELESGTYQYKFHFNGTTWAGNMCNDPTWGDPANGNQVDADLDSCEGENAVRQIGTPEPSGHTFRYITPEGVVVDSLYVAGSFTNPAWTPSLTPMQEIWTVTVENIPAGSYMYKYVFNGDQWASNMCDDPTWGGDLDPDIAECNAADNNNGVLVMDAAGSHTFRYIAPPGIRPDSISVAGNFVDPNWTPGVVEMQETFSATVELEPGEYMYKYVFNGDQWASNMCNDPTWGDPANGGDVDPDIDECNEADNNNGVLVID